MVADKKSQLQEQVQVQDRPRIWKADADVNSTKHANIVISNEPFQHIYWINIATLESAMDDNSFVLPSCSDSRRRSRRLTTGVASAILFRQRQRCYQALTGIISLSLRDIHIICVVNNLVKLYIIVTV